MKIRTLPVTHDKGVPKDVKHVTVVDDSVYFDLRWALGLGRRTLRVSRNGYVYWHTTVDGKSRKNYLHRWVIRATTNLDVDHINGDKLDNCRGNLQTCTRSQNMQKSKKKAGSKSQYRGLSWDRSRNKWLVTIQTDGHPVHLGRFSGEEEAARVYDKAALDLHGRFAYQNFPTP